MYDPDRGYPKVVPYLLYRDPPAAAEWLSTVLGTREVLRVTGTDATVPHIELALGNHIIMLGQAGGRFGTVDTITLVFVDNVDSACERVVTAGGAVTMAPQDWPWGLRQALLTDREGQRWLISHYLRDIAPTEWGAKRTDQVVG